MTIEIEIDRNLSRGSLEVFIIETGTDASERKIAKPIDLEFVPYGELGKSYEPTISLPDRQGQVFLQALSDALIASGFRDQVINKDKEIKRIDNHLQDMRKIAFKHMKIE